jgi:hypothetical protein
MQRPCATFDMPWIKCTDSLLKHHRESAGSLLMSLIKIDSIHMPVLWGMPTMFLMRRHLAGQYMHASANMVNGSPQFFSRPLAASSLER